jgi:hypothetical protein
MNKADFQALLQHDLTPTGQRLQSDVIERLSDGFENWSLAEGRPDDFDEQLWREFQVAQYILHHCKQWLAQIEQTKADYFNFQHLYQTAATEKEGLEHLLSICEILGYSASLRRKISKKRAPWFDANAVSDAYLQRQARCEQDLAFGWQRLGALLEQMLANKPAGVCELLWNGLHLDRNLQGPLQYSGNIEIPKAAMRCLRQVVEALPAEQQVLVTPTIRQRIYRACRDERQNIWLRAEALQLMAGLNPDQFNSLAASFMSADSDTDFYLCGRIAALLCQHFDALQQPEALLAQATEHNSDYVRQRLADNAAYLPEPLAWHYLQQLLQQDHSHQVRAQCLLSLVRYSHQYQAQQKSVTRLLKTIATDTHPFTLRSALYALTQLYQHGEQTGATEQPLFSEVMTQLTALNTGHDSTAIRRWAAQTREQIWYSCHRSRLPALSCEQVRSLMFEQQTRLPADEQQTPENFYRLLASRGADRFGYDIERMGKGLRLTAGARFRFRFWRFLHELRNPATDKRQNYNHLRGRDYYGLVQTASHKMAECSISKVPGEPLQLDGEPGWRGYLPLLDQVLSSLDQGWPTKPVAIYRHYRNLAS